MNYLGGLGSTREIATKFIDGCQYNEGYNNSFGQEIPWTESKIQGEISKGKSSKYTTIVNNYKKYHAYKY